MLVLAEKICFNEIDSFVTTRLIFPVSSTEITIDSLNSSTTYEFWTETTLSNGGTLTSGKATFTTLPLTPDSYDVSFVSKTENSATIKLRRGWGGRRVYCMV